MTPRSAAPILLVVASVSARFADAQSWEVNPTQKHSWSENTGFWNWRDAGDPAGAQGVVLHASLGESGFLSGYAWGENVGWISLGDGSPSDGLRYANTSGSDSGVNVDSSGVLSGLAWGENIGWVNFDTEAALFGFQQHARFDFDVFRIRGYAWGENIGWINLDDEEHFVGFICPADFNENGVVDTLDLLAFLNAWRAEDPATDMNGDGRIDSRDVAAFLNVWASGCA